jgi:hypothetical protein
MNRRGFLGAILAAGVAPVYIKYRSLMVPKAVAPSFDGIIIHAGNVPLDSVYSYTWDNKLFYIMIKDTIYTYPYDPQAWVSRDGVGLLQIEYPSAR